MLKFLLFMVLLCSCGFEAQAVGPKKISQGEVIQELDSLNSQLYETLVDKNMPTKIATGETAFKVKLKVLESKIGRLYTNAVVSWPDGDDAFEYLKGGLSELQATIVHLNGNYESMGYRLGLVHEHYKMAISMIVEYKRMAGIKFEVDQTRLSRAEKW